MLKYFFILSFLVQIIVSFFIAPSTIFATPASNQIEIPIELEVPGGGLLGDGQYSQAMDVEIQVKGNMKINGVEKTNNILTLSRRQNYACNTIPPDPYIFYNPCIFLQIPSQNYDDTKNITLLANTDYEVKVTKIWHVQSGQQDSNGFIRPVENTNPQSLRIGQRANKVKFEWSPNTPIKEPSVVIKPTVIKKDDITLITVGSLDTRAEYELKISYVPRSNFADTVGYVDFALSDDGKSCQFKTSINSRNDLGAVCNAVSPDTYPPLAVSLKGQQLLDKVTLGDKNQDLTFNVTLLVYKKGDSSFTVFSGLGGTITVTPDTRPTTQATIALSPGSIIVGEEKTIAISIKGITSSNNHRIRISNSGNPLFLENLVATSGEIQASFNSNIFNTPGLYLIRVTDQTSGGLVAETGIQGSSPHFEVLSNPAGARPGPGQNNPPGDVQPPGTVSNGGASIPFKCTGSNCTNAAGELCNPQSGELEAGGKGIMTAIGCVPADPVLLINGFLRVSALASGGIALLLMVFGSLQMMTAAGNPETLKKGREQFTSAVIGLLFIIFSVLLLQIIGVNILDIEGLTPAKN